MGRTDRRHYEENEVGVEGRSAKPIHTPQCVKTVVAERVTISYVRALNADMHTAPLWPFCIPATITGTEPQTWLDFVLTVHMSSSSSFRVTSESVEIELDREPQWTVLLSTVGGSGREANEDLYGSTQIHHFNVCTDCVLVTIQH